MKSRRSCSLLIDRSEYNSAGREVRFSSLGTDSTYLPHELIEPSNLLCEQLASGRDGREFAIKETG